MKMGCAALSTQRPRLGWQLRFRGSHSIRTHQLLDA